MSKVRIYGDTSGYVDIAVPAVAGTTTLNLDKIPQADITTGNIAMDTDTLFVDAQNNRIGIGTTSPAENLHINGGTGNTTALIESTDQYVWTSYKDNSTTSNYTNSIGATGDNLQLISPTITLRTGSSTNTGTGVYGTERVRIDTSGNVGIGTDNPSQNLHLSSTDHTRVLITGGTNKYAELQFENDAQKFAMGVQNDDKFFLYNSTGTSQVLTIDTSNNVGIGTQSPGARKMKIVGSSSAYPLALDSTNTDYQLEFQKNGVSEWWIVASASSFKIHENGVGDHLTVLASGNVGIGATTPSAKLEVASTTATNTTSVAAIGGGSINTLGGDVVTGRIFWKGQNNNGTDLYGVNNESTGLTIYNYTDGKYRLYLKNNGHTGIGTGNPSGALDVEWSYNGPDQGIYLKNTNTGTSAYTGTYYGNTSSDTDAFVGLLGTNNPGYAGERSFLLGTNSSAAVAIMVGGTQVHTVAQAPSTSADGYSLTTPALTQTNQLYNMSGTILFDTINNNGLYQPMDYANAIKRYADIGSPTYRGSATSYHNSHSGNVFNSTWCANRELFDMRGGVHFWRVPKSGTYTLTARGAGYTQVQGGKGISLTMDYVLYAGEWLRVICGAQGRYGATNHMGGCGATAFSVYRQGIHIPILIAGGGAGVTPNSPGGANSNRNATAPTAHGNHNPAVSGHYGARDGMGGHGSIYQFNYSTYILNWGGGGGGGWGTPGGNGGIGINMMEQQSGGAALSSDCPRGGYYQNGNAYWGGFGGGGASGISSGSAGGGGGWYGGNSTYSTTSGTPDDTSYLGGGSYAAGAFSNNGTHTAYGQALIQI